MVAEHSSIQSAMMLPELAALVVALGAMAFATWWFSKNGDEKKKVQRNCWTFHPNSLYHSRMLLYTQEEHVSCQCTFGSRLHEESVKVNSLCECSKGSFLTW